VVEPVFLHPVRSLGVLLLGAFNQELAKALALSARLTELRNDVLQHNQRELDRKDSERIHKGGGIEIQEL